jgi:hypothetical protein
MNSFGKVLVFLSIKSGAMIPGLPGEGRVRRFIADGHKGNWQIQVDSSIPTLFPARRRDEIH